MCSIENGKATCPDIYSRSKTPSNLNLAATAKLYGTDGFKNPNNRITYGSKFFAEDNIGSTSSPFPTPKPPTITPKPPTITPKPPTITPKPTIDTDNDGIIDEWDKCRLSPENYNGYQDTDGCPDKKPIPRANIRDFIDPSKGKQYYLDRYYNEPAYKDWFDTYYPSYSIEDAVEIVIRDTSPKKELKPRVPDFVDPAKGGQYYLNRYNNEQAYKDWFDTNYPDYTIKEAIEISIPDAFTKPKVEEKEKFCFLFWCW